uniref:Uncharacterized protein LOC111101752 isoform X2 n=1 Tax=Crassostrea virginica TaxID=6565 RepID=A0A8B8AJ53_CRAVI|nr:uncharacterized protein LOC111101752 isoform X2 [Crassostrea virginica]
MLRGWISSVSTKISRALGGAHDAEYVSEEEVNTSSDIEHIEEGELADQGPGVVPGSPTPGEGEGEGVGENEAVDNRNIPPVVHNTSGTCVDICPEDVMGLPEDHGTGSFIVVKDSGEDSPQTPTDSSGSIEVIHMEDRDLQGTISEQPSSSQDTRGSMSEQPNSACTDSLVIIQEEFKDQSEPHCGSDLDLAAAMMESVCRDLENADLDKCGSRNEDTGKSEKMEGSEEDRKMDNRRSRKESEVQEASVYLSEEERSRRESEVQELSMVLSEEDTSVRRESAAETDVPQKTDSEKVNPEKSAEDVFDKKGEGKETKSFDLPVIVTTDFEPKKQEKSDKKSEKQEPENYLDYVQQRTEQEELEPAKNLIYKLGMLNVDQKIIEAAILDQYKVAVKKKCPLWIKNCRYHAELLFSPPWISEHLPKLGRSKSKDKKKWQNRNERRARNWEKEAGGMCRDVRLKEDPTIDVVHENAAGDKDRSAEQINEVSSPESQGNQDKVCVQEEDVDGKKVKGHVECEKKLREEGKTAEQDKEGKSVQDGGEVRDSSVDKVINEPRVSLKHSSESVEQKENKELNKPKESLETKTKEENSKSKPLEEHYAEGEQLKDESRRCSGDDVKQRKKLSPCKKGKSVKAREIDLSVSRKEGTESGSHPGRERRKSDLYDKRKDRIDDSVTRDSKKPKTETEAESEELKKGPEDIKFDGDIVETQDDKVVLCSQIISKEVEDYAKEIIQSSIEALSLEDNTKNAKVVDEELSSEVDPLSGFVPNITDITGKSTSGIEEKPDIVKLLEKTSAILSTTHEEKSEVDQDVSQEVFDRKAENMISSLSRFSEADGDGSPFLHKDSGKEMLDSASQSSPLETNHTDFFSSEKKSTAEVFGENGDSMKTDNLHGILLVSPDCVMSPKCEVPPNTPASGYANNSQPTKLKNLNLMQNKAKLEKEVADLLSGLTLKFRHPVASGSDETQTEESRDYQHKDQKTVEKKTEGSVSKECSIQTSDSAIISANSSPIHDGCVEEMERLDLCMKQDLSSAEEGRCSPEEYLSMLQHVLPNVTSITKLKPGPLEDQAEVQCSVVSSSTNTGTANEKGTLMIEDLPVNFKSLTEVVDVCDLSVAENVEVPCQICTGEEKEVFTTENIAEEEEGLLADQGKSNSLGENDEDDDGITRIGDPHNYCLSQTDGGGMDFEKISSGSVSSTQSSNVTKKRCNSAKSSVSRSLETEGQFTKLKLTKTLSKSEEKLKNIVKPPWNSNTKVDHGKAVNVTPSRIPKAAKPKSGSKPSTKAAGEKSKCVKGKMELLMLETKERMNKGDGETMESHQENGNGRKSHAEREDSSESSEKSRNPEQIQKVLSEIEKGRCQIDQVEKAQDAKEELSCQSVQTSGNMESDENKEPSASASIKAKTPPPKWKSKNTKKGKGRQKNRW